MTQDLLRHLCGDVWCTLGPREGPRGSLLGKTSASLHASVGVFAVTAVPPGTVVDRNLHGIDTEDNYLVTRPAALAGLLPPAVLAELHARCAYDDKLVIPRYGLNIFRVLAYIKRAPTSQAANCCLVDLTDVDADQDSSGGGPQQVFAHIQATRAIAKGHELLLAPEAGKMVLCGFTDVEQRRADPVQPRAEPEAERKKKRKKRTTDGPGVPGWGHSPAVIKHLQRGVFCALGACAYGVGSFAIRDIPKNTVIDLTLDGFDDMDHAAVYMQWTAVEQAGVPLYVQQRVQTLYQVDDEGIITVSAAGFNLKRLSMFVNHGPEDNVDYFFTERDAFAFFRTKRAIKAGEELTINYHLYLSEEQKLLPMFHFLKDLKQ